MVPSTATRLTSRLFLSGLSVGLLVFSACTAAPKRNSLVAAGDPGTNSSGGSSNKGGTSAGGSSDEAGAGDEAGAAGDGSLPSTPVAVFGSELEADVGCGATPTSAGLQIFNQGGADLEIKSATASDGYVIASPLPLVVPPGASRALLVTPKASAAAAKDGDSSTGQLSFTTNEPGTPSHDVKLTTHVVGAVLEFTDKDGVALSSALTLTYSTSLVCPDLVTYRVHNRGSLVVTLKGPKFPANFTGFSLPDGGQAIAPDGYAELNVTGDSSPGGVCGASGMLTFTAVGALCGSTPPLAVEWPASGDGPCVCPVPVTP